MKKYCLFFALIAVVLLNNSCSNDFELNAPWRDVPVVYGLLSKLDTAHYIRVEKAFLDASTSALELAQRPDSLYYENAAVRLEQLNGDNVVRSFNLNRVDGNLEGYEREPGVFADAPNFLYKLKLPENETLQDGATYRLVINRGDDLPEVTATTALLSDIEVTNPVDGVTFKWSNSNTRQTVQWRFNRDNAVFFDVKMNITYNEAPITDPTNTTRKTVTWPILRNATNDLNDDIMEHRFFTSEFFQFLSTSIEADPDILRTLVDIEVQIDGGGEDLFEYINVGRANTGITSSQIIPTYTNLSEGFGVFSSRASSFSANHNLENAALDSLRNGFRTAPLNFQ
ncbi:MAG: DUF4249 family protein [Bacteroidota bacterium]